MAGGAGERICELLHCMSVPWPLLSAGFSTRSAISTISLVSVELVS